MAKKLTPVLITTTERSLYFGYIDWEQDKLKKSLEVVDKRHIYSYVTKQVDGECGCYALCTTGPQEGSRVSPRHTGVVHNIHSVNKCSAEAVLAFEAATW